MNTRRILFTMVTVGLLASQAAAQTPVQSFEQLSTQVSPGVPVVVHHGNGRRTTGKVTSIADDRIEIGRRRWNFRTDQLSFSEGSVVRIERNDSAWNGTVLGVGVGAAVAWARCRTSRSGDLSCLGWIPLSPLVGGVIGGVIDSTTRQPLFVAPRSGVHLRPVSGRGVGATVSLGF